jgi:hypothetical protein
MNPTDLTDEQPTDRIDCGFVRVRADLAAAELGITDVEPDAEGMVSLRAEIVTYTVTAEPDAAIKEN